MSQLIRFLQRIICVSTCQKKYAVILISTCTHSTCCKGRLAKLFMWLFNWHYIVNKFQSLLMLRPIQHSRQPYFTTFMDPETCIHLKGYGYTYQGGNTVKDVFAWLDSGNKFFTFRVDTFLEVAWYIGMWTGIQSSC